LSLAICLGSGCESIQKTIYDLAKPASPPKPSPVKPPAEAEAKATLGDLKSFWTVISGYDYMSVPSIRVELIFLSNKTKLNVFTDNNLKSPLPNITKLELYVLRIKIEKECPKIEPKKRAPT